MSYTSDSNLPARRPTTWPPGWRRWGATLLVVGMLLLLLEGGHRWLESRSQAPLFRVIVAGETLTLEAETHTDFLRDLTALADEAQVRLAGRMTPWVEARLEGAFAPLEAAVPGYLEWHFSATGSYTRLGVALVGDLDGWLDRQLHARLVAPSGIEAALAELQADYPKQLADEQRDLIEEMAGRLYARYAPHQVAVEGDAEPPVLDLDLALLQSLEDGLDRSRWQLAAVGGGGLGLLAGRTVAARLGSTAAGQGGRLALRSLTARLGGGAARALMSGGAVAAASAPAGPGALVAGTVTSAATLAGVAGTEYALLKAQEALQRPAMQAQLYDEIAGTKASLARRLEAATLGAARAMTERLSRATVREREGEKPETYRILGQPRE